MTAEEILKTKKIYALVGATQDETRYGYELLKSLRTAGYTVLPVNPKYQEIDGIACYPSLKELPQKPEVVITALAPANTEKVLEALKEAGIELLWMPPGCCSDAAVQKSEQLGFAFVHDVCPIGTLLRMAAQK